MILGRRRIQKLEVGLRDGTSALPVDVAIDQCDRRLRQDALRGIDDLEAVRPQFADREQRLVFPGDQDVADAALDEGRRRAARAGIQHRHVAIHRGDKFTRLRVAAPRLPCRVAPRGQIVPARAIASGW
jgi:hypothetical protein